MDESVDEALSDALERIESGRSVSTQWLQQRCPSAWRELRDALELDRDLVPVEGANEVVGGVRIGAWIGTGALGAVFEGTPESEAARASLPARVAVKLVHGEFAAGPGFAERFAREVERGAAVVHANLVRTLAWGVDVANGRERPYLVSERVEGETLRLLLDRDDRLPEPLCRRIGLEVALGLAALHAAGAVHGDVKPENLILADDDFAKLMDFGSACLAEEMRRASPRASSAGTALYAAPEQFAAPGASRDPRSDLYSLGVVLFELVSGAHPFGPKDPRSLFERRMGDAPPVSLLVSGVSPFFEAVIARLLDLDPNRRFPSAREFAETLARGELSAAISLGSPALEATGDARLREDLIGRMARLRAGAPEDRRDA